MSASSPAAQPHRPSPSKAIVDAFIARWSSAGSAERANYGMFLTELCDLLGLPHPDPAGSDASNNAYTFERAVPLHHPGGKTTTGRIDLYKRGYFVLEAKQYATPADESADQLSLPALAAAGASAKNRGTARGTEAWDRKMLEARAQAERYARSLPADEEPPPFLLVVDVGHSIEFFADFTQKGKAYLPFPDARTHRIRLADLAKQEVRERLIAVWTDPASLDPAKKSAEVTREVAKHLAELARLFEKKHDASTVAAFLSRCLFCMFAEDVDLLPRDSFSNLLESVKDDPRAAVPVLEALFREMNKGGYSLALRKHLLHFNGGLFAEATALPLDGTQLGLLRSAARLQWRHVEPAIFGTLLERALDPRERHKLGAHYTPRAYVERLVLPTVIDPLREQWENVRAAAVLHATRGDLKAAVKEARAFHHELCSIHVLDPACGSGNFLYVTLEHLKRLEGEVLELIESFGENMRLDLAGETVDPHQFLGIELNPRAATVAELVLWIGYLQWHHRNRGSTEWPEPVLKAFHNIECRDAVLACDREELAKYADGHIRYVWDRRTYRTDPATGREVPDETARIPLKIYLNPRPAPWPAAEYIVGNPPFLGKGRMREELGDGYAETLRRAYPDIPDSADFVMYWWHKAAELTIAGKCRRFGFITTNSIRQTFNRRVVKRALDGGLSLRFAIPDHPWVDTSDGAAVRISMTVGALTYELPPLGEVNDAPDPSALPGDLFVVAEEVSTKDGSVDVKLAQLRGRIGSGLNIGAELEDARPLKSNDLLASTGLILGSRGFVLSSEDAQAFISEEPAAQQLISPLRNGEDLTGKPRNAFVIDTDGWSEERLRTEVPRVYQHLLTHVRPDRETNRDPRLRKYWWLFRRSNEHVRAAIQGLPRYVATVETAKHRVFVFLDADVKPEHRLVVTGSADAFHLGVLNSRIHVVFALAAGGTLEDRPVYNKSRCFDPFPFPDCTEPQKARVRELAEAIDAHRKQVQAKHGFGLTDIYNVLEKLRVEAASTRLSSSQASRFPQKSKRQDAASTSNPGATALTPKERKIHDAALVSTLKQLHDDLDAAVADAYGWPWPMDDAEILTRVVALNAQRAAEEARGIIRYLRPDYQQARLSGERGRQGSLDLGPAQPTKPRAAKKAAKLPWPKTLPERTKAVDQALATEDRPVTATQLATRFSRAKESEVREIVETLAALGRARPGDQPDTWLR